MDDYALAKGLRNRAFFHIRAAEKAVREAVEDRKH